MCIALSYASTLLHFICTLYGDYFHTVCSSAKANGATQVSEGGSSGCPTFTTEGVGMLTFISFFFFCSYLVPLMAECAGLCCKFLSIIIRQEGWVIFKIRELYGGEERPLDTS